MSNDYYEIRGFGIEEFGKAIKELFNYNKYSFDLDNNVYMNNSIYKIFSKETNYHLSNLDFNVNDDDYIDDYLKEYKNDINISIDNNIFIKSFMDFNSDYELAFYISYENANVFNNKDLMKSILVDNFIKIINGLTFKLNLKPIHPSIIKDFAEKKFSIIDLNGMYG